MLLLIEFIFCNLWWRLLFGVLEHNWFFNHLHVVLVIDMLHNLILIWPIKNFFVCFHRGRVSCYYLLICLLLWSWSEIKLFTFVSHILQRVVSFNLLLLILECLSLLHCTFACLHHWHCLLTVHASHHYLWRRWWSFFQPFSISEWV